MFGGNMYPRVSRIADSVFAPDVVVAQRLPSYVLQPLLWLETPSPETNL